MSSNNDNKRTGPLQELFSDIAKIIEFMEVKDKKTADSYETDVTRNNAAMWKAATLEQDSYISYQQYWTIHMFQEVVPNVKLNNVRRWMNNPMQVPATFRENLLIKGREAFLNSYEETNDYYRMINGLPPMGTPESEFIYLSEPTRNMLHATNEPVHKLSTLIQNNYMATDEYKEVVANNPDKKYLKYIGLYKVDIYTARNAKDFEIIRYPSDRSDINPNLLTEFAKLYADYREYVMVALYNEQFENLYVNYREFMGLLIMIFTLLQINNRALEAINSKNYLDDSVLYEILSMYSISGSVLLTNEVRRNLAIGLAKLTQKKGTSEIYYDLVDILGYPNVNISKLYLMKGQQFTGKDNTASKEVKPYFLQIDLKDPDPYKTIISGNAPKHNYEDIISGDPTWWDDAETQRILQQSVYSMADSKYIMIEAMIPQIEYMFESIYFSRLILDNKNMTDTFIVEIPEIFGTEGVSLYDLMLFIISATCMNNGLRGDIIIESDKPQATAGFNFDMDLDSFAEYVNNSSYLDKEKIMSFIEDLTMKTSADVTRLYNDVMYPMRSWLENKIAVASTREEFLEYENVYRAMFSYDITRNNIINAFKMPIDTICDTYGITHEEMLAYQHFYPHTAEGKAITVDAFGASRYIPFISRIDEVAWNIHVTLETHDGLDDRGYLYFYDILNCKDCRELVNENNMRIFMDYKDDQIGWEINNAAVEKALELIDALDENDLKQAFFVIDTMVLNSGGKTFAKGQKLPMNIRTGLYKQILHDKILMDCQGLSNPPKTYREYLFRKNVKLYNLLTDNDRFERDKQAWLDDVMKIILAVETEINLHMKYLEQSVLGSELFFKPLLMLINHFKSTFVRVTKTRMKYSFTDKMDAGGNSNMFKLFDQVKFIVHFVTLAYKGFESQFGLYDTIPRTNHHIILKDIPQMIKQTPNGYKVTPRTYHTGSMHIVDEVKFFKNGTNLDPDGSIAYWISGEPGTGRWSEEDDFEMKTLKGTQRVKN